LLTAWFCSPAMAQAISRPISRQEAELTAEQRHWLWQLARKTWAFFQTHVGPGDNWLPPDNVQESVALPLRDREAAGDAGLSTDAVRTQPAEKIAHRISPTNEGLFLVSALAAHDLGCVGLDELADLLELNLNTWEKLERYQGHHFNWYDTVSLQPLAPRYVSTVDSGNLVASLLTMHQGLNELAGHQAQSLRDRLTGLADRCGRLAQEMDFRFLFDSQRRLFHIGFNLDTDRLDRGHYDLLASEARLASYVAIAKGDADHRHWFQMGRSLTGVAERQCLLSWSGSMFEYLMPTLFTRTFPGSLLEQTCRAAVARQIEYGQQRRVPWGISESSFAALNDSSDWGYRAFGVPGLGLQRGLGRELVVAPYASVLALGVDASAAARNLNELAREGALGRHGFFDAIDYTPGRIPPGQRGLVVPCYMTHHQGMSLIALANCLRDGCMQRRFHSHPAIRAAELLLQERVPECVAPLPSPTDSAEPLASHYHSPSAAEATAAINCDGGHQTQTQPASDRQQT
jgi:cyclic beta-1,2-glucan glucanotransferase